MAEPTQKTHQPPDRRRRQRGNTLVESALSLLIYLVLLLGVAEFGRMIYTYNWVAHIAREATRYASVRGSASVTPASSGDIRTFVTNRAVIISSDSAKLTVNTTWAPNNNPGSAVTVQVQYAYSPMIPLVPQSAFTLHSSSTMRIMQ